MRKSLASSTSIGKETFDISSCIRPLTVSEMAQALPEVKRQVSGGEVSSVEEHDGSSDLS